MIWYWGRKTSWQIKLLTQTYMHSNERIVPAVRQPTADFLSWNKITHCIEKLLLKEKLSKIFENIWSKTVARATFVSQSCHIFQKNINKEF